MSNPFIPTVFAADPAAHVWPGDDRIWVYTSHDEPGTNSHYTMPSYHVFSSRDMVNWTDHGCVLHLKNVSWAISHMWAIDAVLWKGMYYLVYCAIEKNTAMFRTGMAISKLPQGPFTDIGYIQGVDWGQDPSLFVDDDGTPYLFWGCGNSCHAAELNQDLLSIKPETKLELTQQLTWVFEAPFVHKYQGKYYLSYPGLLDRKWPERMYYAIADKPLGPYKFMGEYIPKFEGQAGTNHGSIVEYKGHWYAFHHSSWQSQRSEVRSLMCDYLYYNPDGSIKPITPTQEGAAAPGVKPGLSRVTLLLEAEVGPAGMGELRNTRVSTERPGYSGNGYVTGIDHKHDGVVVFAQQSYNKKYRMFVRYAARQDVTNSIIVNNILLEDKNSPDPTRYAKVIPFPKADNWTELEVGMVDLKEGDNYIKLLADKVGGFELDYFRLEPLD